MGEPEPSGAASVILGRGGVWCDRASFFCCEGYTYDSALDSALERMSCLFHSIGAFIGRDADRTRRDIVEFMTLHAADVEVNDLTLEQWILYGEDTGLEEYVGRMQARNEWGGCIEIVCATVLYDVCVDLYLSRTGRWMQIGDPSKRHIAISYTGSHYTPRERR
jgi:hypothetical protein